LKRNTIDDINQVYYHDKILNLEKRFPQRLKYPGAFGRENGTLVTDQKEIITAARDLKRKFGTLELQNAFILSNIKALSQLILGWLCL